MRLDEALAERSRRNALRQLQAIRATRATAAWADTEFGRQRAALGLPPVAPPALPRDLPPGRLGD